jgi:hypothetical protein
MLNGSGDVNPGDFNIAEVVPAADSFDIDERVSRPRRNSGGPGYPGGAMDNQVDFVGTVMKAVHEREGVQNFV